MQRGFDLPVNTIKHGKFPVVFSNGILKYHNEWKVKGPGVVTGRSGTIGKVTYVEDDFWPHNTSLWVTDFKGNLPKFIYHFYSKYKLERFGTGSGVPTLNRNDVHSQKELFPSYNEQLKITAFLDVLDKRIQTQSKIINQLESLIKGIGKDLFSRKIRFNKFKGDWHRTRLHDECDINPKSGNLNNQFIYIDLESVQRGQLVKRQMMNKSTAPSRADRVLKDRDVLFQCVRPYQMNNYIYFKTDDLQWVASTGYALIRTSHNSRFIYYLINQSSFNKEVMIRCTGTSYPAISSSDLGEIKIEICSIEEQHAIAGLLSSIDEKLKLALQLNKMYQIQKNFLLSNLFI